jgi:hydrogenase/urease accessory protein HupE
MKHVSTLLALATLPGLALAHGDAGHGFMANLEHILTSADHLWPLAVVAIVAGMVKRPLQRLLQQRVRDKD